MPDGGIVSAAALAQTRDTLRRRLAAYGIVDADVQTQGTDQIAVSIPRTDDAQTILAGIGHVGLCEFIGSDQQLLETAIVATTLGGPETVGVIPDPDTAAMLAIRPPYPTIIQSADIATATTIPVLRVGTALAFTLTDTAAQTFGAYTEAHIGRYLSLVVDKHIINSSVINSRIDKDAVYEGSDPVALRALAALLQSGPLPQPLDLIRISTA